MKIKPIYNTMTFAEIFETSDKFLADWLANPLHVTSISDKDITNLYYLLYAKYGNSPIANMDVNQFKYKVFAIIFQYGPTWVKRLDIQDKLRSLTEEELMLGTKAINNHAYNPSSDPSTSTLSELEYINEQNTTNYKRSKLEAYSSLINLLKSDVTEEFLRRFKVCFKVFASFENPLIYVTEVEEGENNDTI